MEQEEKGTADFYYQFFNESDTAMAVLDHEGRILTSNKHFENLYGSLSHTERQSLESGRANLTRFAGGIPDSSGFPVFWSALMPVISGKSNYVIFQCPFYSRPGIPGQDPDDNDSVLHWFNVHAWRIKNIWFEESHEDQTPQHQWLVGLILEDYNRVRQEERKLLLGKEIAEKAMEAKDQFLANMSHEIRTPIQTIMGMTELLQETSLDREQSEYSRQVKFSAEVLLTLINDILDYSKIEAGKMALEHIAFNLEPIIEQSVEMIALEAHKKGLYTAINIPLDTGIIIRGDPNKFRQIVINLVKNAVKFTKAGGVTVTSELAMLPGGEAIRISVADTGIGVDEEIRPKLFSTFMQGDVSNTRRFGGTGLGLAISYNLVQLMKGHIEMVPNEGGGSIFRFEIPLERSGQAPAPLPPPEDDGKIKMLIVDDKIQERKILDSYLRDLGYTDITHADSGEEALEKLRTASGEGGAFQLCFLDMIMPVMDGWRLAAEINNDSLIKNPELILMVPHGLMGADTKMTLLKWFKAYINKPIKRRNLAETISLAINEPLELEDATVLDELIETRDIPVLHDESLHAAPAPVKAPAENRLPVLIAEDHPVNQKLFSMVMEKLGYASILADDGRDALEKVAANNVALIFMDIQMPRMNGYEAAEKLREQGFTKPIIAVTASALSDEREHCLKSGIDDILVKPFKRNDIEAMLEKWINVRQDSEETPVIPIEKPDLIPVQKADNDTAAVVFSAEEIYDTYMGNKEMIVLLLPRFIERTREQLKNIPELEAAGDYENGMIEAHTIKGAAYTMSGMELGRAAARLELAFKNREAEEIRAAYPPVKEAFSRFEKEAEKLLSLWK